LRTFGLESSLPLLQIILPLGISFYTFESISYVVEVFRGRIPAERQLLNYCMYLLFFPRLIAGPIVRPQEFLPQLRKLQQWNWDRIHWGVQLFILGFIKKALIADRLAPVVDPVFADPSAFSSLAAWCAILAYSAQIYCDFSGYSDMAIGLGHLFGLKLPVNFRFPYLAVDVADFWRRWHLSLSTWLRSYLYNPLGGHRFGKLLTCRNLFIVMFLGGLWHGANWTFVVWGLYHGVLLILHRILPWPEWIKRRWALPLCLISTFLLMTWGRILFRAESFSSAGSVAWRVFFPTEGLGLKPGYYLMTLAGLLFLALEHGLLNRVRPLTLQRRLPAPILGGTLAATWVVTLMLLPDLSKIFIYFQF
jgi:alginate O-acetyltransferase complex protein AlgI